MHMSVVVGYLVGLAQVACGLAILSGALIRLGAACIIVVTLGAIFLVHLPHGFDIRRGGIEYALTQLLISIALLITGAGPYSLVPRLPKAACRSQLIWSGNRRCFWAGRFMFSGRYTYHASIQLNWATPRLDATPTLDLPKPS
jgi:hypothetical protein